MNEDELFFSLRLCEQIGDEDSILPHKLKEEILQALRSRSEKSSQSLSHLPMSLICYIFVLILFYTIVIVHYVISVQFYVPIQHNKKDINNSTPKRPLRGGA